MSASLLDVRPLVAREAGSTWGRIEEQQRAIEAALKQGCADSHIVGEIVSSPAYADEPTVTFSAWLPGRESGSSERISLTIRIAQLPFRRFDLEYALELDDRGRTRNYRHLGALPDLATVVQRLIRGESIAPLLGSRLATSPFDLLRTPNPLAGVGTDWAVNALAVFTAAALTQVQTWLDTSNILSRDELWYVVEFAVLGILQARLAIPFLWAAAIYELNQIVSTIASDLNLSTSGLVAFEVALAVVAWIMTLRSRRSPFFAILLTSVAWVDLLASGSSTLPWTRLWISAAVAAPVVYVVASADERRASRHPFSPGAALFALAIAATIVPLNFVGPSAPQWWLPAFAAFGTALLVARRTPLVRSGPRPLAEPRNVLLRATWNVVLEGLGDAAAELRARLDMQLRSTHPDVVRSDELRVYRGPDGTVEHRYEVFSLRRALTMLRFETYGSDLSISLDGYVNRGDWREVTVRRAFDRSLCRPVRLTRLSPSFSPTREYDDSDADALIESIHLRLTAIVKALLLERDLPVAFDTEIVRPTMQLDLTRETGQPFAQKANADEEALERRLLTIRGALLMVLGITVAFMMHVITRDQNWALQGNGPMGAVAAAEESERYVLSLAVSCLTYGIIDAFSTYVMISPNRRIFWFPVEGAANAFFAALLSLQFAISLNLSGALVLGTCFAVAGVARAVLALSNPVAVRPYLIAGGVLVLALGIYTLTSVNGEQAFLSAPIYDAVSGVALLLAALALRRGRISQIA